MLRRARGTPGVSAQRGAAAKIRRPGAPCSPVHTRPSVEPQPTGPAHLDLQLVSFVGLRHKDAHRLIGGLAGRCAQEEGEDGGERERLVSCVHDANQSIKPIS